MSKWSIILFFITVLSREIIVNADGFRDISKIYANLDDIIDVDKEETILPGAFNAYNGSEIQELSVNARTFKWLMSIPNLTSESFSGLVVCDLILEAVVFPTNPHLFEKIKLVRALRLLHTSRDFPFNFTAEFPDIYVLTWQREPNSGLSITLSPEYFSGVNEELDALGIYDSISQIEPNTFARFEGLRRLSIGNSDLSILRPGMFNGLRNLKELDLGQNEIETIEVGTFKGLSSLTDLILRSNQLKTIESGIFNGMRLAVLRLDDNEISEIKMGSFQNALVHDLWLEKNHLKTIPDAISCNNIERLLQLYLNENQISVIHAGPFQRCHYRFTLEIRNNGLEKIEPDAFNASTIEELDLGFNKITELENTTFRGASFEYWPVLDIRGNHIQRVHPSALTVIKGEKITLKCDYEFEIKFHDVVPENLSIDTTPFYTSADLDKKISEVLGG